MAMLSVTERVKIYCCVESISVLSNIIGKIQLLVNSSTDEMIIGTVA